MNYCSHCGNRLALSIPDGDDRARSVCGSCGRIHYQNPKLVVGCIPEWNGSILLCKRSIEPRYGMWTIPAGFLESGETVVEGAQREAHEEALARVDNLIPFALYNITFVDQIYLIFRARLIEGKYGVGSESLDAGLYSEKDIPWDQFAFTVVRETLKHYFADRESGTFRFHMGDIHPDPS